MINREIFDFLKSLDDQEEHVLSNSAKNELEQLGFKLAQKLKAYFPSDEYYTEWDMQSRFNFFSKWLYVEFSFDERSKFFIQISFNKINVGFHKSIQNCLKLEDSSDHSKPKIEKYFRNFKIEETKEDDYVLKASHALSIRNLNSRDFVDYVIFLFRHAKSLIEEVDLIETSKTLQKSA